MTDRLLTVSSSPHIRSRLDTRMTMMWVLIALAPAGFMGCYVFGARCAAVMAVTVASCVLSEYLWNIAAGHQQTAGDLSAAVTGLLLAYNLPPSIPLWMAAVGGAFAVIVVKQFFGGIGCNIVNPALAARAVMLSSWPVQMTTWTVDGISCATPLAMIKDHILTVSDMPFKAGANFLPLLKNVFLGFSGGCIGETSEAALIIGFALLVWKRIIDWRVPVVYIAAVAALSVFFGRGVPPVYEIFCGGLFLGAIFMATDYTTTPMTRKGRVVFALGCGVLTLLIRTYGGHPEGVSYSILIMNLTVPLIDRFAVPRIFGEAK